MYIEDKSLICFFLRTKIDDPANRVGLLSSQSITLSDDLTVSVSDSSSISHISNVVLDSTNLVAFIDYYYDIKNRRIVFLEAKTGDLTYDVYGGVNWIFDDSPRKQDLSMDSFPRISIIYIERTSNILGNFDAPEEINNRLQIDVWTKKDNLYTIDLGEYTTKLSDDKLVMYLSNLCYDSFKDGAWELTNNIFKDMVRINAPSNEKYNVEYDLYNSRFDIFIKKIK